MTRVERIFNGEAVEMPTRPSTSAALIKELQADPTCIGILPRRSVGSGVPKGLKILTIGGKRAGDENYAL